MAEGMTIIWTGQKELAAKLTEAVAKAPALLAQALFTEANVIMTAAKKLTPVGGPPYSPYDKSPGTLRASGTVKAPEIGAGMVSVELGFGGAASVYAMIQHEHTEYPHHVGQAKFLQTAMMDAAPTFGEAIAARLGPTLF